MIDTGGATEAKINNNPRAHSQGVKIDEGWAKQHSDILANRRDGALSDMTCNI